MSGSGSMISLERLAEAIAYLAATQPADHERVLERLALSREQLDRARDACGVAFLRALSTGDVEIIARFSRVHAVVASRLRIRPPVPEMIRPDPQLSSTPLETATRAGSSSEQGRSGPSIDPPARAVVGSLQTNDAEQKVAKPSYLRTDGAMNARAASALPPPALPPPATPGLSVEQYAWVVAALRRSSHDERGGVLERFRLTPETEAALHGTWRARFEADPLVHASFEAALAAHQPPPSATETAAMVSPLYRKKKLAAGSSGGTHSPDDEDDAELAVLPFRQGSASEARAPETREVDRARSHAPRMTVASEPGAPRGSALPFPRLEERTMSLQEYARASALMEREADPESTLKKLNMDASEWMSTVRSFAKKFAEDPSLQAEFERLVRHR